MLLHMLADPVRPLDFIIDDELLRKSLEQHLLEHSISPVSSTADFSLAACFAAHGTCCSRGCQWVPSPCEAVSSSCCRLSSMWVLLR
jgi:hypothetical protein